MREAVAAGPAAALWPAAASGWADLEARAAMQEAALSEDRAYLQKIEGLVRERRRHRDTALVQRLARVRERHTELSHLLLRVMGKVRVALALAHALVGGFRRWRNKSLD